MASDLPERGVAVRFSRWILTYPRRAIALALLIVAVTMPGTAWLKYEYGNRSNYYEDNPLLQELDVFQRRFGASEGMVVAVHHPDGIFTPQTAELLRWLTAQMWLLPDIIRVDSLTNFPWVHADGDEITTEPLLDRIDFDEATLAKRREIALRHEMLPGYLIGPDAKTTLIFAFPNVGPQGLEGVELVAKTYALLAEAQKRDPRYVFHIGGDPAINNAFGKSTKTDATILGVCITIMSVLLLGAFFRTVTGVLLPLLVVALSVGMTLGLMGWLGIVLTPVSSAIPNVLIAVCFADAIHLLWSFRVALGTGRSPAEAAYYTLVKNFVPTILTTITVAMGFLSFATVSHKGISGFGIGVGLGSLAAWPITYLLIGPALPHLRWSGVRRTPTRVVDLLMSAATTHRRKVEAAFVIFTVVLGVTSLRLRIDSNLLDYFPKGSQLREATEFIERNVGSAYAIEMVIDTRKPDGIKDPELLRRLDAFETWIVGRKEVSARFSIVGILKEMNRALNGGKPEAYRIADTREEIASEMFLYEMGVPASLGITDRVVVDKSALRVTILWSVASAARATDLIEEFTRKAREDFALGPAQGVDVSFAGRYVLFQRTQGMVVEAFVTSELLALVQISLLLMISFRSVWLGLLALPSNLIPLVFGAAVLVVLDQPLDLGTVLLGSVCLGIACDDTMHVIGTFRENLRQGMDPEPALRAVLTDSLPALAVNTAVLVGVFGSFVFATMVPTARFGVMAALILGMALFADLLFLPALLLSRFGGYATRGDRTGQPSGPADDGTLATDGRKSE